MDRSDDILPLYRPDLLPLPTPDEGGTTETFAAGTDDRIEHLRRVPLFADCTDEELGRIADISRIVESPVGTVLTEIGTPGDSFFFIIDGRVSVQTPVGTGDPLHPGDFCAGGGEGAAGEAENGGSVN